MIATFRSFMFSTGADDRPGRKGPKDTTGSGSLEVDHHGRVQGPVGLVAIAGVDEDRSLHLLAAVAFVDVAEDVQARADSAHGFPQLLAAHPRAMAHGQAETPRHDPLDAVADPVRWAVGHEDVDAGGDSVPLGPQGRPAVEVESPAQEPRLPGTAPDAQALHEDLRVLQVDGAPDPASRLLGPLLEEPVVVPRDHDLEAVGQVAEPLVEALDLLRRALHGRVTRVDEQVAIRHRERGVTAVGVGDADDAHPLGLDGAAHEAAVVLGGVDPREAAGIARNVDDPG